MPVTGSISLCNHVGIYAVPVPGASETYQNQQLPQKQILLSQGARIYVTFTGYN